MPDSLTPDEAQIAAAETVLRERHVKQGAYDWFHEGKPQDWCNADSALWPCPTIRVLDALTVARAEVEHERQRAERAEVALDTAVTNVHFWAGGHSTVPGRSIMEFRGCPTPICAEATAILGEQPKAQAEGGAQ